MEFFQKRTKFITCKYRHIRWNNLTPLAFGNVSDLFVVSLWNRGVIPSSYVSFSLCET